MGLAHSAVAFDYAVTTTFSQGLALWGTVGTVGSQGLALWGAIGTVSGQGLTLWSAVRTILSDQAFFFQAIITTFGNGLTEHRVAVFHLWGGLVSGWQGESGAGQHGEGKAKQ